MTTKFWMVLGGYGDAPTVRHNTLKKAEDEARRLCDKHGKEFVILEAMISVRPTKPPIEVVDLQ